MSIEILTGLPGAGKTTHLIRQLRKAKVQGKEVYLFLCSDSAELRSRPNVKVGGQMGCRTPGLSFTISHFTSSSKAIELLDSFGSGVFAAFDEAAWFSDELVSAWVRADKRGVEIIVSSLSDSQLKLLAGHKYSISTLEHSCMLCGYETGTVTFICAIHERTVHLIICEACRHAIDKNKAKVRNRPMLKREDRDDIINHLKCMKPFPGKKHAYQPLIDIDLPGWDYVRGDSPIRAGMINEIFTQAYPSSGDDSERSYIDLGCCTGYFCEYFYKNGFISSGVDIDEDFITLASKYAKLRNSKICYSKSSFNEYIEANPDQKFDISSSFATVQWVMAQKGLEAGLHCFDWLFKSAKKMCVIEMGYSEEDIYEDKLPINIDKQWVIETMDSIGEFDQILVIDKGTRGVWRDLFIGLKEPENQVEIDQIVLPYISKSNQASTIKGGVKKIAKKLRLWLD